MRTALIVAMLTAGAAEAATVAMWRGPGPNACHGACPLDWALEQLTDDQRAQVLAAMDEAGASPILVHEGEVFEFMTYQRGGEPYVDRRRTVAAMDGPARAWGWRFDDWSFVQLEACGNWAPVVHAERVALRRPPAQPSAPGAPVDALAPPPPAPIWGPWPSADPVLISSEPQFRGPPPPPQLFPDPPIPPGPADPDGPVPLPPSPPSPPPPVAAVPAPQGAALLLAALGLAWARARRRAPQADPASAGAP